MASCTPPAVAVRCRISTLVGFRRGEKEGWEKLRWERHMMREGMDWEGRRGGVGSSAGETGARGDCCAWKSMVERARREDDWGRTEEKG
jgi:hypothetical protein